MLLAVDIGNTNIHNGIFDKRVLKKDFRIPTYSENFDRIYKTKLKAHLKDIDHVIVTSVVPVVLKKIEKIIKKIANKDCIVVGMDVDSGIKNLYRNPKQVGS